MLTSPSISMTSSACKKFGLFLLISQVFVVCVIYYMYNNISVWTKVVPTSRVPSIRKQSDETSSDNPIFIRDGANTSLNQGVNSKNVNTIKGKRIKIAIGMGVTTRKLSDIRGDKMQIRMPFFHSLLSSFCKTCSQDYDYHFFLAHDYNDPFISELDFASEFERQFATFTSTHCGESSTYSLHLVVCSHTKKPAWAQNDAMLEAYISGMDYFYRVNDDTVMKTPGWTEIFIRQLDQFNPPRVGVVGPHHSGGNTNILTYDFTHRTHLEVHGFYYPRSFPDWYADKWITDVYKPGRSTKIKEVLLVHTMENGQRYTNIPQAASVVMEQIEHDRATVLRYVTARETGFQDPDPHKVVSMSLASNDSDTVWGAVRNAQLMSVLYPGWAIRFYIRGAPSRDTSQPISGSYIPDKVVRVLRSLRAEIIYVNRTLSGNVPTCALNYLVADDPNVSVFLVRNPAARLGPRGTAAVAKWLGQGNRRPEAVHSIKDHPKDSNMSIVHDQWGARVQELNVILKKGTVHSLLKEFASSNAHDKTDMKCNDYVNSFLNTFFLDKVKTNVLVHDSVSCDVKTPNRVEPFPMPRRDKSFVGQTFDVHESPVSPQEGTNAFVNRKMECETTS